MVGNSVIKRVKISIFLIGLLAVFIILSSVFFYGKRYTTTQVLETMFTPAWALTLGVVSGVMPCLDEVLILVIFGVLLAECSSGVEGAALAATFVFARAVTFSLYGIILGLLGLTVLQQFTSVIRTIAGLLCLIFGIVFASGYEILPSFAPASMIKKVKRKGFLGASIFGFLFGFSVFPCFTPGFVAIGTYILSKGDYVFGGFMSFLFGLGLGLHLIIIGAVGGGAISIARERLPKYSKAIRAIGGVLMIVMGVLLLTVLNY